MLFGLGVSAVALGATLRVPQDYATIQIAVNAAVSGDSVLVGPGSWAGFNVAIPLTVRSSGGAGATTVTGGGNLIQLNAGADLSLAGFLLVPTGTRALRVRNGARLVATDLIMRDVAITQIGAFAIVERGGTGEFYNVTVERVALGASHGVLDLDGDVIVQDAHFTDNTAQEGGFAYLESATAKLVVTGGAYTGGRAARGGAIYLAGGTLSIDGGAVFSTNTATTSGGAIHVNASTLVDLRDVTFAGNSAPSGGAIYQSPAPGSTIARATFCANHATAGAGGAMYADTPTGTSTWTNNLFVENTATTEGGAVHALKAASAVIANNTFTGNAAGPNGGAALRLKTSGAATVINNVFANSSAGNGVVRDAVVTGAATYDAWYLNSPAHQTGYTLDATHLIDANPLFTAYTANGDCTDDRLWPTKGSPLIDRGDIAMKDSDGTRSDLGAYGGPGAISIADADGDGVLSGDDCDDNDAKIGLPTTWYLDGDNDGWGSGATSACVAPPGASAADGDCNDADGAIHPTATELCDGVDNNCDLAVDEAGAVGSTPWYADDDTDGFGAGPGTTACAAPAGYVGTDDDCDDNDAAFHPGAPETCTDTVDFNCDGSVALADADKDGHPACEECDDSEASIYPGAPELCDGLDQDCDGKVPTEEQDGDGDGSRVCDGDCDDGDATVYPGAPDEPGDGIDADCDGEDGIDTDVVDADGDGFPGGATGADCDDEDPDVNPDAADPPGDGVDQNCSGTDADVLYVGGLPGGCGCRTGNALDARMFVLGLMIITTRRRRR